MTDCNKCIHLPVCGKLIYCTVNGNVVCDHYLESEQATSDENKRWIPVSERLPEEAGYVLAFWKYINEDEMYIDRLNYNGECFPWESFGSYGKHKVTHWMPLPTPPKE